MYITLQGNPVLQYKVTLYITIQGNHVYYNTKVRIRTIFGALLV